MPVIRSADGTRIHYITFGPADGEPLLLIHGLGTDHLGWIMQRPALAKDFRCIAIDNRGSGRSDKPIASYELTDLASDALAVLDAEGVESAHVVGASMGGVVAQILAVTRPGRVRSLVLACTACNMGEWREELFREWIERAPVLGMRRFMTENLNWLIGPRSMRRLWPIANVIGIMASRSPSHGVVNQLRALLSVDQSLMSELATITAPTLVVVGSQDILTPVADSEQVASMIPGAEFAVIRGAAHGLMFDHARTFNSMLLDFLETQTALDPELASNG